MKNLKASDEFIIGKHSIGYLNNFGQFDTATFTPRSLGSSQKLGRNMYDSEIESELKPSLCDLGDVLALLDSADPAFRDGYANIFYLPECVVRVFWYGSSWGVGGWPRGDDRWGAGNRVFSPATGTETLGTEPSDPLTLALHRIQRLEDNVQALVEWKDRVQKQ